MHMGKLALDIGPTDDPLLEETIGENLARTVQEFGSNDALVSRHQDIRWSYTEFAARVAQLAKGLMAAGLEVGDRVGLWSPNYAEWTLVQYATAEIGVILVNCDVGDGIGHERRDRIGFLDPRLRRIVGQGVVQKISDV